jgi:hypothetical protein
MNKETKDKIEAPEQRQIKQQEKMTEEQARNLFREIFTDYGLDLERIYREGIEL